MGCTDPLLSVSSRVGSLPLYADVRLHIPMTHRDDVIRYRVSDKALNNLEFVTLASSPAGTSGAFLRVNFDSKGPNFGYLEACMRLVTDGATTPLFLSSGAEDFFLSASYFDEGMFKTENSGLTFFEEGKVCIGLVLS